MNAARPIIAAGFAVATTGAFAETGVVTYQPENVANVYGRAGAPNVKLVGAISARSGKVADAGSDKSDAKLAVTAGKDPIEFGRS
jgi:hypothetical protein